MVSLSKLCCLLFYRITLVGINFPISFTTPSDTINRQRPIVFIISVIFAHFFLWYTAVAITKWNPWIVIGTIISFLFTSDFLLNISNFTIEKFLALFPKDGTERVSYEDIIKQYVVFRRYLKQKFHNALQFRQDQPQQFLISSLFFTLVICFALSMLNLFLFIYIIVMIALVAPGLWYNEIPKRIYIFALPHVTTGYQIANDKIADVLAKKESTNTPKSSQANQDRKHANHDSSHPPPRTHPTNIYPTQTNDTAIPPAYVQPQRPSMMNNPSASGYTKQQSHHQYQYAAPEQYTIPPPNYFSTNQQPRKRHQ